MKTLIPTLIFLFHFIPGLCFAAATKTAEYHLVSPHEISTFYLSKAADEKTLPPGLINKFINGPHEMTENNKQYADELFEAFASLDLARMPNQGGQCLTRALWIFKSAFLALKKRLGYINILCPANDGNLIAFDRANHNQGIAFTNYHYANIILVRNEEGQLRIKVLDPQFEDGLVSLSKYLGDFSRSQVIRPMSLKATRAGVCYWNIFSSKGPEFPPSITLDSVSLL